MEDKLISTKKCIKYYGLNDDDLKLLKRVGDHYRKSDVEDVVISKYGKILSSRQQKIEKRKKLLKQLFEENKLELKNNGDCYSYIYYGDPSIEDVINNELNKCSEKSKRRIILAEKLDKKGIELDENNFYVKGFINGTSTLNLSQTVKSQINKLSIRFD